MVFSASCRESKIISYIGNFVPSLTEIGILTNCVNVYDKVSNFVRTTNKLVHSVSRARDDWQKLHSNINDIYEDISYLKEINPYDMETWEEGLTNFSFALKSNTYQAIRAFEMLDAHTIGAVTTYSTQINSIIDYKREYEGKKESIKAMYSHPQYESELIKTSETIKNYRSSTIAQLRALQSADQLIIETSNDKGEREDAQEHFTSLEKKITSLEENIASELQMEKPDSIIDQTANLIAINLTEVKVCNERLAEMQAAAQNLVSAYYRLTGKNLNIQSAHVNALLPDITISPENFDPNDPDKVAAPMTPSMPAKEERVERKDVSNHDIISLYNGASFLGLRQECLKRDITAMKINTMAFIVTMEAYRRNKIETSSIALAHSFRMVEIAMEELK